MDPQRYRHIGIPEERVPVALEARGFGRTIPLWEDVAGGFRDVEPWWLRPVHYNAVSLWWRAA